MQGKEVGIGGGWGTRSHGVGVGRVGLVSCGRGRERQRALPLQQTQLPLPTPNALVLALLLFSTSSGQGCQETAGLVLGTYGGGIGDMPVSHGVSDGQFPSPLSLASNRPAQQSWKGLLNPCDLEPHLASGKTEAPWGSSPHEFCTWEPSFALAG